ncbi:hypothetical protein FHS31_001829 [Sphingomonas vulcanisoli]|uniref:DUF4136 domain-containing protein n=1 Tax=Sphingomonas vulcanisoli TaxID=1658060 RepID=A0ABX0TRQ6_9SPHN|nr:DUF4136 domain-containing protein [Sphingomonas vulcanisoli]NIJ08212.1 hypothetical protein [Sphingomonas vulcanisoli]
MSLRRTLLSLTAPIALLAVAGCAPQPFRADVSRFQAMPAPQGQTFWVQSEDPAQNGGLEFSIYARQIAARLAQQGYQPAAGPNGASLLVNVAYGVDNGHEKMVDYGPTFGPGWGWGGGFGWGGGWGGRGGWGRGWYGGGWGDPFWADPWLNRDVQSYTYYVSRLEMRIVRPNGQVLFEGNAKARSLDDNLQHLVPNLIDAMFTGFPGRSGENVLITIAPPPKAGAAAVEPARREAPINRGNSI